jgi:diacylglycerol kinase (ATP)
LIPQVRGELTRLGVDHELVVSGGPDEPVFLARNAARQGSAVVAALGGDGLTSMVANGMLDSDAALGIIPCGNGNDFSRTLGLDRRHPLAALRAFTSPRWVDIDVVRITTASGSRCYLNVAGAGFDSEVNEAANRMHRLSGTSRYLAALAGTLRRFEPARFDLVVDGSKLSVAAMLVAVGNGRSYGGGMRVCPGASLSDGAVEMCVIGAMRRVQFIVNFPKVFRGTHVTHPKVSILAGSQVELSADRELRVYADGEPAGSLPARFEVLRSALKVVVP